MNNNNIAVDKGRLQVRVTTEDEAKPIGNAKVQILDKQTKAVIEELTTDSSGQTEEIELGAPPLEYSLQYSDNKPYSEYDLRIEAEDYEPVSLTGVQILPVSEALQNTSMRPRTAVTDTVEDITIAEHTLWGVFPPKIPEDEVKPLPNSSGLIVLPEPVIPEYVVVHLGTPSNTSARNVWIPFKSYIKNVASCEIYSTWPTETIKANVTAIISFTLNRVYTEWYRGKGYSFTITNSTAYDHAFTYGRNIYASISRVVDDIFTNYITRPNIEQPLLAQYCDGVRVNCATGMKQWGSKDLGAQGYSAINILRSYYGYNIYYEVAGKVEGVPLSYPGAPLRIGSSGEAVRTIQSQLNRISNNYPAIPKVRVDGAYGSQTANAVRAFQKIFNLPQSGAVDFATWYQISNIYVAVTKIAELR